VTPRRTHRRALAQLDEFAAWPAEHGEGRVLETDSGKPH